MPPIAAKKLKSVDDIALAAKMNKTLIVKEEDFLDTVATRPIIYHTVESAVCDGADALVEETVKQILGWETEKDYTARMIEANPHLTPEECKYEEGDFIEDLEDNKVRMWNNDHNRPFYRETAMEYAQSFLTLCWAGPTSMPGMMEDGLPATVNGEPLIIGRTGIVISGQHRSAGYLFACQRHRSEKEKYRWRENWPNPPVFETILITGISESLKVIQTVDNVRPRDLTDTTYVAGIFAHDDPKKNKSEQRECSRMLGLAISIVWERTGTKKDLGTQYQTNSASMKFLENHPSLAACVRHLFDENKNRGISAAKMSPGQCAGMMYMMAAAKSDGDTYRNSDPPMEKLLDLGLWDDAKQFWLEFAVAKEGTQGHEVRKAIGFLADEDDPGKSGRLIEKMCVIAKAWACWQSPVPVTFELINPAAMYQLKDGVNHLVELSDFGGIDIGPTKKAEPKEPKITKEQLDASKILERQRRAQETADKIAAAKAKSQAPGTSGVKSTLKKMTINQIQTAKAAAADAELAKVQSPKPVSSKGPKPIVRK